ncbi:MAG: hypothetical protein HRT72_04665 [Flavobacteriales bacterium]|nr:hypothetical protein [Flavobacteriales bacterium]
MNHFKVDYVKKFRDIYLMGDENKYDIDNIKFYQTGNFYMANLKNYLNGGSNEFALNVERGKINLFREGKNKTPLDNAKRKLGLATPPLINYYFCRGNLDIQLVKPKNIKSILSDDPIVRKQFSKYRGWRMFSKFFKLSASVASAYGVYNLFMAFKNGVGPSDILSGNTDKPIIMPFIASFGIQIFDNTIFNQFVLPRQIENTVRLHNGHEPIKRKKQTTELSKSDIVSNELQKQPTDKLYSAYYKRVLGMESRFEFIEVDLKKTTYASGDIKWIGIKAKHRFGADENYSYKIGAWNHISENGRIKEVVNYDLTEKKPMNLLFTGSLKWKTILII